MRMATGTNIQALTDDFNQLVAGVVYSVCRHVDSARKRAESIRKWIKVHVTL